MGKFTEERTAEIKEKIRAILVRMPRASKYRLAKILNVNKDVALRLRKEVRKENLELIDKQVLKEEVAKMEDAYQEIELECWKIISREGKPERQKTLDSGELEITPAVFSASDKDVIRALKTLVEARKKLFEVKFDSGLFVRKFGELTLIEMFRKVSEEDNEKRRRNKGLDSR